MGVMRMLKGAIFSHHVDEKQIYKDLQESLMENSELIYSGALLARAANKFPDKVAINFQDKQLTYKELYFRSVLLSKKIQALGIKPRDRVLMSFENSIDFFVAYFAIWQVGAICVPLNTFLHEKELVYIARDAGAKLIISSDISKDKFESLAGKEGVPLLTSQDIDYEAPIVDVDFEVEILSTEEMCLLLYTSGTTGTPKGVMLSSKNIISNATQGVARFSKMTTLLHKDGIYSSGESFFAVLPLFHVFAQNACVWFPILIGATIVVVPKIDRRDILKALGHKPTVFFGVPALYGLLCIMKTAPLESVKFFVSGGDALPDKIRAAFALVYGRKICGGYGLTEASPVISVNVDIVSHSTSVVGKPLQGIECEARSDSGNKLDPGIVGTLWVRGDNVMLGYYNAPGESAKVLNDGWLNTGDLGQVDSHGYIEVIGRSKDLIIHKGFNIYPQEVENVLLSHPSVFKAAVIGHDDTIAGQVPVAYIALKSQDENVEKKLRQYCKDHLAVYKIPRRFICLDDLPMNATGKVDKKLLNKA